ncbi:hypothetical protein LASUN_04300 [Lentilactobacillus sunkii]|uniref:Uncharacterized protein n=1 Tax=Lentilactobacillus sunkii TaxID=481719 RepID=A0A1E7XHY5_9LACO|nr:hypothetical protein [Lentilactobacillus sunkii]OFA12713.1 hypothetical protein LASUN_04300 [Lentilactobacillus sunkii]
MTDKEKEYRDFMRHSKVTWNQYKDVRKHYGNVGSFAYWPTCDANSVETEKGSGKYIAKPLIANTEDQYNKGLSGHLHNGVVLLGYNFGVPKKFENLSKAKKADLLGSMNDMSNQYGGQYGKKSLNVYLNENYYHEVEGGKPTTGYGEDEYRYTDGAYMTDFFKFDIKNKLDDKPTGIPSKYSNQMREEKKAEGKWDELVRLNAEGLKKELDTLGAPKDVIIAPMINDLKNDEIKNAIRQCLGEDVVFIDCLNHYAAYSERKNEQNKQPLKAKFAKNLIDLNKKIGEIVHERCRDAQRNS